MKPESKSHFPESRLLPTAARCADSSGAATEGANPLRGPRPEGRGWEEAPRAHRGAEAPKCRSCQSGLSDTPKPASRRTAAGVRLREPPQRGFLWLG